MRVAIYSPYLDTLGGGERYMMTIAESLSSENEVDVLVDLHLNNLGRDNLKRDLKAHFNLNLENVNFILGPVGKGSNSFERLSFFNKYDALFYLTDGSIFYPTAKKNILHIQSPLIGQAAKNWWGKLKLRGWDLIIYNSKFTKDNAQKNWPINCLVIYPPVDIKHIKPLKKKKYILSVGRFFGYLKSKRHEILIQSFKDLYNDEKIEDWSLHLVGSAGEGDKEYVTELESLAKGFPINFYPNLNYDKLIKLYGNSSIYWHAAGFGEDNPAKMEHFGISTVEAMAGGCVPVVIAKGGQLEVVEDKKSGFLFSSLDQLKQYTIELMGRDLTALSKAAIKRAKKFSKEEFSKKIKSIV